MAIKIIPTSDRVLMQKITEEAQQNAAGIFIPVKEEHLKSFKARILEVGPGRRYDDGNVYPVRFSPGQIVSYGKFMGEEITIEGVTFVVIREDDIVAVLEEAVATEIPLDVGTDVASIVEVEKPKKSKKVK